MALSAHPIAQPKVVSPNSYVIWESSWAEYYCSRILHHFCWLFLIICVDITVFHRGSFCILPCKISICIKRTRNFRGMNLMFFKKQNYFPLNFSYPWDMSTDRNMALSILFQCFGTPALIYFMIVPQLLFMAISLYFNTLINDVKAIIHNFDYTDTSKLHQEFIEVIKLHAASLE